MQPVSSALKVGARLELKIGEYWLPSRLEDHPADASLTVGWPTLDRQLTHLQHAQPVEVLVAVTPEALFAADAVVDKVMLGALPLITLSLTSQWRRSQRRNAFRTPLAVKPRLANKLQGGAIRPLRLGITNISAGGVQVRSQDELHHGDLVALAFELDGEVQLQARVVRVQRLERVWEAGCEFEGISRILTERIVQFIFAQQRMTLRQQRGLR